MTLILLAILGLALVGAYSLGYTPKALYEAAKAKIKEWLANWQA